MTSLQTKTVDGYGPYVYRVTWTGPDEQEWQILGRLDEMAGELTAQERENLGVDEDQLSKYRVAATDDVQRRDIANSIRDELVERYGEYVIASQDDRRSSTIKLSADAPRAAREVLRGQAEEMEAATKTISQEPLTDAERERADFSARSVFWWRAAKADLKAEGVSNWTDYVDVQREDPHSHSDDLNRSDRSGGERLDEYRRGEETQSQVETMSRNERRAVEAVAEDDDDGAREYLRETAGYDPDEIDAAAAEVAA